MVSREIALTEVYLDHQTNAWSFERTPAHVWASEIAKAAVWIVGTILVLVLLFLLAPETRADTLSAPGQIASYLDAYTDIPLAVGVDVQLAKNLIAAQNLEWGKSWFEGSLQLSEDAVLRAISLYIDDSIITRSCCSLVWAQSNVAIDPRLSSGFGPASINFGEVPVNPVSTPEPMVYVLLAVGVGVCMARWGIQRMRAQAIRERLEEYRGVKLV